MGMFLVIDKQNLTFVWKYKWHQDEEMNLQD